MEITKENKGAVTIANIKLIADYMGYEYKDSSIFPMVKADVFYEYAFFDSNWDLLMRVIQKISQFKYEDGETAYPRTFGMPFDNGSHDNDITIMVRFNRQPVFHGKTLIKAAYDAVMYFINIYNQNKSQELAKGITAQ